MMEQDTLLSTTSYLICLFFYLFSFSLSGAEVIFLRQGLYAACLVWSLLCKPAGPKLRHSPASTGIKGALPQLGAIFFSNS